MTSPEGPKNRGIGSLTAPELVLALMHSSNGMISGALYLQKIAFLVAYEDEEQTSEIRQKLGFKPLNFGPYSQVVRNAMDRLISERKVVTKRDSTDKYNKETFFLTEDGVMTARLLDRSLDAWTRNYIERLCSAAKQLGYAGLLRYVYRKYESFTSKSEIVDDVIESYDQYRSR